MREQTILLSGATGFLGRELVHHLLASEPDVRLVLLARGKSDDDARRRIADLLGDRLQGPALAGALARCEALRADLEAPRLGLGPAAYDDLRARIGAVIHGAASVSFTLPIDEARRINVDGTRRMLDLAADAGARLDYIGTAYVAGERRGPILEAELDLGQRFHNTYEQTKMEAERLVRARGRDQPVTIFRPSIIVGDSETGRASSFKVLYWPLKIYSRGFGVIVPGRRETPVDVVPSDYVVKAIAHLRRRPESVGKVYHLTAGPERAATLGRLTDVAAEFFAVRRPLYVDPALFIRYARPLIDRFAFGKARHVLLTARVYTPYLSLDLRFDTRGAREDLAGSGVAVPDVESYFLRILRYAVDSEWGKRPPPAR